MRICLIVGSTLRVVAVFFLVAGCLLYETVENRVEDILIKWWVALDDAKKAAVSKTTAFMQGVARIVSTGFDLLLGERVFSWRSIGVSLGASLCFTCASFWLFGAIAVFRQHVLGNQTGSVGWGILESLYFICLGVSPAIIRKRWFLVVWAACVFLSWRLFIYIGFLIFLARGVSFAARYIEILGMLLAFSYLFDLLYICSTRWILRIAQKRDAIGIILMVAGNIVLGLFFIFVPVLIGVKVVEMSGSTFPVAGVLLMVVLPVVNSVDILASWLALAVALFMLVHRFVFWPLVLRPLYGFTRLGIGGRRTLLWGIGICLWNNQFVLKLVCKN